MPGTATKEEFRNETRKRFGMDETALFSNEEVVRVKWAVESYFAPDERSKGEWNTLRIFDDKDAAEHFAQVKRDHEKLWTKYYVREIREKVDITNAERRFLSVLNKVLRNEQVDRTRVDRILLRAASALEKELL